MMNKFRGVIDRAAREGVSDIYITGGHSLVSRRHGGAIQFDSAVKWSHHELDDMLRAILTPSQLDTLRERKSVDCALSISGLRFRINAFTTMRGISLAVRVLPGHIPTIEELNLHPSLNEISKIQSGLVLTCGSTGVGKTTTVAAIIDAINNLRATHILTLENPIEYRFQSKRSFIQQRELGAHMPSFAQGLLDAMRENPDVIVVSELRESDTMQIALSAAESGHLVIGTMHASTPEEAIYRFYSAYPADSQNEVRYQLASTLQWLIIQQLVYMDEFKIRVPLLTIVRGTTAIRNTIRENRLNLIEGALQIGRTEGMFTAERYMNDYLKSVRRFTMPSQTFRPSAEAMNDISYESPLTKDSPNRKTGAPRTVRSADNAPTGKSELIRGDAGNMLIIDEDASLHDLIGKLKQ